MLFTNIQKTVGYTTYETIKNDIIFGNLNPGLKLKLEILKNKYNASISTLRETLNRLASEGFVLAEEQRGFFVSSVSKEDLVEIANLRILIESHALNESIKNGDTEWEANLVAAYHKLKKKEVAMEQGDDSQKELWKQMDCNFHQAMIQACNSKNLLAIHSIIYEKYLRYQMLVLTFRGTEATQEHKDMFDATLERDTKVAQEVLEKHILNGLTHAMNAFDNISLTN